MAREPGRSDFASYRDWVTVRPMLTSFALLIALWSDTVEAHAPNCDEPAWLAGHGRADRSTRHAYRRREWDTCKAMGATDETCTVLDAIAIRESSGDACSVHVLGPREYGLGMHGLNVGLHLPKWDASAERRLLHLPEVSTVVTMRIFQRAVGPYRARRWREVAAVFAGRFEFDPSETPTGDDVLFCRRLTKVGVDCNADPRGKLGKRLRPAGQDAFVLALLRDPKHGR